MALQRRLQGIFGLGGTPGPLGAPGGTAVGAGAAPTMTTVGSLGGQAGSAPRPRPTALAGAPSGGMPGAPQQTNFVTPVPLPPGMDMPGAPQVTNFITPVTNPQATPGAPPPTAGPPPTASGSFGPGNDLRFTAIGSVPRIAAAGAQADAARNAVANAPDRMALVQQALADYDIENAPGLQRQYRQVGQLSAALGRNGSGMTDQDIGDVQSSYQRNRMLFGNSAIRDAVSGTLNDRLNQLGALGGEESRLGGEFRSERDYHTETAERARREQIESLLLGEQLYGSQFNRDLVLAGMGDPGALAGYFQGAGAASGSAASNYYAGAGGLLGSWLSRRNNPGQG